MKLWTLFLFFLIVAVLPACIAPTPSPPAQAAQDQTVTIRFAISGDPNVRDIPFLLALEQLRQQGYAVAELQLAEQSLVVETLARGDADIGSAGAANAWAAAAQGGRIRTIFNASANLWSMVAREGIETCADLNGARVGLGSSGGLFSGLFASYLAEQCPGVEVQTLLPGNSSARLAAMLAGEMDVAVLEIEDIQQLDDEVPGGFHTLVDFRAEYPDIFVSVYNVNSEWAANDPQPAKDFILAQLEAIRRVNADSQVLEDGLMKYMPFDASEAHKMSALYLNPSVWDPNGGMTLDSVSYNLDFLESLEAVPAGFEVNDVADLSYLDAVLNEIGRQ